MVTALLQKLWQCTKCVVTVKLLVNLLRIQEFQVSNLRTETANHETFHSFISPLSKFWGSS